MTHDGSHDTARPPVPTGDPDPWSQVDCQSCGACCAFSPDWPRFSTESEEALERIAAELVADDLSGMRCEGVRCAALVGAVGQSTACSIYADRPDVCRACVPGGDDCRMARAGHGLPDPTA